MGYLSYEVLNFLQAQLTGPIQVLPLKGDASLRCYYRVLTQRTSYVLMMGEAFKDQTFPFLSVQRHFIQHNIPVPHIIAQAPSLGAILLEDLGDLTLERKFQELKDQKHILPLYKQAIDQMIRIHSECTQDHQPFCTAFQTVFDTENLLSEMNYARKHFLEKAIGLRIHPRDLSRIKSFFMDICTQLHQQPKVICHRDYHSRNLMIRGDQIRVIDFQDARLGPRPYDLVSLCHDSYVDLTPESINTLIDYYRKQAHGLSMGTDEFMDLFQQQTIQRCFKVCGNFSSFYNLRGDRSYLKYLNKTINKVDKALEHFPNFFRQMLRETGILERDFTNL